MNKSELRNTILSTTKAPRHLVVQYVKLLCGEAKALPASEREARGDYHNPDNRFPQTKGEDIASDISSCLAQQHWMDWDSDPALADIGSIAGSLEINTDDHELWQELFEKVEGLKV